jgi:glycosyltransferase involved in cell wall biosynthesis
MKKNLISVIVPNGRQNNMVGPCLNSIVSQTYKDIEIIAVRDKNNQIARNTGAEMARGEFLFFCDDDIILKPDILERMIYTLKANKDASYVYCDYDRYGIWDNQPHKAGRFNPVALCDMNYISMMSMVRAKDFPGLDPKIKRLQDWDLWLNMLSKGKTGIHLPKIGFCAYYGEGSISLGHDLEQSAEIVKKKWAELINKYST